MSDPFLLPPQSVVSFSGGRTSGYLLHEVCRAHRCARQDLSAVIFCNTGLEHEATYRFVEECSRQWDVPIRWLEYRWEPGRHFFVEVTPQTASRDGEPFRFVIRARGFLPNPVMRFCTAELKIRTSNRFVRQVLGWEKYRNAIGLRADEPKRVAKMLARRSVTVEKTLFEDVKHVGRGASHPPGESPLCPLADAGVTNADVLAFWRKQPFDLQLPVDEKTGRTLEGNCRLCFLKSSKTLIDIMRADPGAADWWVEMEKANHQGRTRNPTVEQFRKDRAPYEELRRFALDMAPPPLWTEADYEGLACGEEVECNCTD